MDLSGSVKLVPLKEQLAREEHVTSSRAGIPPGASSAVSLTPGRPCWFRQSQLMQEYGKSYLSRMEHLWVLYVLDLNEPSLLLCIMDVIYPIFYRKRLNEGQRS